MYYTIITHCLNLGYNTQELNFATSRKTRKMHDDLIELIELYLKFRKPDYDMFDMVVQILNVSNIISVLYNDCVKL